MRDAGTITGYGLVNWQLQPSKCEEPTTMAEPTRIFRGENLSRAFFTDVSLAEAVYEDVNLSGAKLSDVNLIGAQIRNANMSSVRISKARLRKAVIFRL
jgi:uncharacterized protein YjbI with pentapeptide repeats